MPQIMFDIYLFPALHKILVKQLVRQWFRNWFDEKAVGNHTYFEKYFLKIQIAIWCLV